ncbi:MAG: DNA alkylation repair protein [Pseudomonadales bacterium]|nr:DNA alkylation repair protein [Pseudomonadales bacterium]
MADPACHQLVREALDTIARLRIRKTPALREVRRTLSRRVKSLPPDTVLTIAAELVANGPRWVGYELINQHPGALRALSLKSVRALGAGNASWQDVDAFGVLVAGPAWMLGRVTDAAVLRWAASPDLWWRRTALVATTVLNSRSRGGRGDVQRTLAVVDRLKHDREDMVVKAVSWALRSLVVWDRTAVDRYLAANAAILHARVRREVGNKLRTGRKNPGRVSG